MNFDKIYEDFTNNILPTIKEGVTITKDYAFDLFERYINYLIFTDILDVIFCVLLLVLGIYLIKYINNKIKQFEEDRISDLDDNFWKVLQFFNVIFILFFIIFTYLNILDIIKDLTVPEVRIYEILQNKNTNK